MVFKNIYPAINSYLHLKRNQIRKKRNKIISSFDIDMENTVFHRPVFSRPFMALKSRGYFAFTPDFGFVLRPTRKAVNDRYIELL